MSPLLLTALCTFSGLQDGKSHSLPDPVWRAERGEIAPNGVPLRIGAVSTYNGKDVVFSATEEGPQTLAVYASGRRFIGGGDPLMPGGDLSVSNASFAAASSSPAPWVNLRVLDSAGISRTAALQGGRVMFYPGQDLLALGIALQGEVFEVGVGPRSSSQALVGLNIRLGQTAFRRSVLDAETDGFGRVLSARVLISEGDSIPQLQNQITSLGPMVMSAAGKWAFSAFAYDWSNNRLDGVVVVDDQPVLRLRDLLPGTNSAVAGIRTVGINDAGDWSVVCVLESSEYVLLKNGSIHYRSSEALGPFGIVSPDAVTIHGMAPNGTVFWHVSGQSLGPGGGPAGGNLLRVMFRENEVLISNAGSELAGEPVKQLSFSWNPLSLNQTFLSFGTQTEMASGGLRESVAIIPLDASTEYCSDSSATASITPTLGVYGAADLDFGTGFQVMGRSFPPLRPALVLASETASLGAVLGNSIGELCLGGRIWRSPPLLSSELGDIHVRMADFLPQEGLQPITAGDRWHFQVWYRDRDAAGAGVTRLSEAVLVDFR